MTSSKIWSFIGSNVFSLVTIFSGLLVVLLDQLKLVPAGLVPPAILGVLALLATSELVEGRKKVTQVDEKLDILQKELEQVTHGYLVKTFANHEEALLYHARLIREAKETIDHAALDYRRSNSTPANTALDEAREKVALENKVYYRYVAVLHSKRRLDLGRRFRLQEKCYNFYPGYFRDPLKLEGEKQEIPLMSFIVVDKTEVFARYPYNFGRDNGYIAIKSPYVANLFLGYFERIWEKSHKLESMQDYLELGKDLP